MSDQPSVFLFRELAELAYAIAKSDGHVQRSEVEKFRQVMVEEFGEQANMVSDWLEVIKERKPRIKDAYQNTFSMLKSNSGTITPLLKEKYIRVFEKVANAFGGIDEKEEFIIERFKEDIQSL